MIDIINNCCELLGQESVAFIAKLLNPAVVVFLISMVLDQATVRVGAQDL